MPVIILQALKHWRWIGVGLLMLALAGQTWRLDRKQLKIERLEHAAENALSAMQRGVAANKHLEKVLKELAHAVDDEHKGHAADAMAAGRRYADTHRVPKACPIRASAPAEDRSAGVPERVPADSLVAVHDADVQACSAATAYAVDAFKWASGIEDLQESGLPSIY